MSYRMFINFLEHNSLAVELVVILTKIGTLSVDEWVNMSFFPCKM